MPETLLAENVPIEFINYLNYVKLIRITETPDYEDLRKLFKKILTKMKASFDRITYEWVNN